MAKEKDRGEEYIYLPTSLFNEIAEEIERKAQFSDNEENFFRVCAFTQRIRDNNQKNIFLTNKALNMLKKLYDKPCDLPF